MQAPRSFRPQSSFSKILSSKDLVDGLLPTFQYKPRYCKYLLPFTPCYHRRLRILAAPLSFSLPVFSLQCPALAKTYEKHHGSFIVLAIRVCRLGYPAGVKLEKAQKTSLLVFDYIWFWYIYCSTKSSYQKHNFQA